MAEPEHSDRPSVQAVSTEAELRRWYWLRSELVQIARLHGLRPGGSKIELTERIASALAGRAPAPPPARAARRQVAGPLSGSTVLPAGQRCTQALRAYLVERIGPGFRFDSSTRDHISAGGTTLDDVVAHWHATRHASSPTTIAPQFEYNRFTREWRTAHPEGTRDELLEAWWAYRNAPRSPVAGDSPERAGTPGQ